MGGLAYRGEGRGHRRRRAARRFRASRRGVVSVVGTLLSLLVFFALFGIFITQYVPLWMTDNEATFTANTQASLATLKSNVDFQIASGSPPVFATPFSLSSEGVPLVAQPTAGILNFIPNTPGVFANVSMSVGPGGGKAFWQNYSLGTVQVQLPNRYYSAQTFSFEDDAVIQSQTDLQQVIDYAPLFNVSQQSGNVSATLLLLQMFGNASQAVSSGTLDVYSHLDFTQTFTSTAAAGKVSSFTAGFAIGTHYPCAWATFLNSTLARSSISASHFTLDHGSCIAASGKAVPIHLTLLNVVSFTLVLATFQINTGVGVS